MKEPPFQILLVEDNRADVYLFRKALENTKLSFELTVISDGSEALDFVGREGKYADSPVPDLAILDLNLPKNDGSQVLEAIRRSQYFSKVPVVITSSSTSPHERIQVERLGIAKYFRKPPHLEEFLQIGDDVRQLLLQSKARQPHE
jgi:two-component system response regulator